MEEQGYQLFREPSLNPWGIEPPLGYIEQSLPSRMDLAVQGVDIQAIPLTAQSSNPSVFNTAIADPLLGFSSSQSGIASSVLTNDSLLSSPVVVNQEAASFSFASHNTSWVGAPQITQLDNLGEVLVVPGTSSETVSIVVQWTFRDAKYNNEVGVFVVDQSGKVGGLSPSEQGFAQTALQSSTRQTLFNSGHAAGNWRELTFTGGSILAFYLIQNGTSENWLANNPSNTVSQQSLAFFSLLGSNPDGFDHSRSTHLGKGIWRLNWEDLTGGGDQDFNDVVFNIGQPGILLPGQEKQTVPLTVELFDKEATYQNQMGYFLVDAPDGKIGDLLPGDKGYRKAALERHETVFTADGLLSGYQVNLPSAKYLGWYLVSNATATQAINNEQISVFFSYSAANADGLSHLHAQQDSHTWAWEDVFGGGDRDFNDLVFRFDLGEPMGLPTTLPHLSIGNVTVTEGDQGTQDANFAVRLSEASIQTVTAQFATKDDTAKAGEDYEAQMGIVSFAPGELEKTISVKVTGDRLQELTENFKVNLANANNALITQGVGTGTILENDNLTPLLPSLSIGDVTVTEGDEGTQKANFAVRLSQASEQTVTAEFVTEDDTAKNSEDYEAQTGIITFAPGEVEKMIAVNIKGDRRYELTESFKVNLANAKNALISQGVGIVTILDNDPLPTITVQNTSIVEGDGEPTKAEFEISLSEATSVHVTVEYETLDGTAKVGEDYQSNVGSLTFAPGETRRFIDVPIVGDLVNEADEVFTLRLKNPTNSTLGNSEAQGTIINDDAGNKAPSALGLTPTTVNENIPNNSAIAEFSTVDINVGDTHSYQLVKGDGDLDNNAFAIVGNGLQIKQSPNFEEKAIYQIRVRTTDQDGLFLEKAFTINIADINEAPTVINLSNNSLSENIPANSLVGTINGQDPDAGDSLIYELVNNLGGEDNGSFTLISNELRLKDSPNFEAKSSYNLRIKAIDKGSLSLEKNFVIQITDVNEAPFFISQPILTAEVGTAYQYEIKAQDPDTNDILTISAIQNPLNWTKTDTSNGVSLLSQIPTINDIGQHIFEWKVQDSAGLIATQNYTLAVSALLKEANNFSPSLQKVITIPATPTILQFKIEGLSFDQTDTNSIKDAFEVELVDAQGNSLVHTIGSDKTAFFNITEGLTASLAPGVTYDANTGIIRVNLVGIQPNTTGNLILRLVNNDQDTATQVRITDITLENAPPGTVAPVATPAILALQSVANPPNLTNLVDVTGSMEVQYQRTTLNEDTNLVYADFNLKNIGSYSVNTNLLVAIKNISDPTVQVRDTNGVTLEGLPYYDFTDLLVNGKLDFNQVTNSRSLVFFNPNQVQFTYDVVVLAVVNRNPIIQTQPELEIIGGQAYQYDVNAIDPDLDNLSYRLLVAPQGMTIDAVTGLINWQTATTNIGNQVIKVEVADGRGGLAEQGYTLSITGDLPNRPPTITSTPIVDGRVKGAYLYDVEATDPDSDTLTYELTQSPTNMAIESDTGVIHWLPTASQLGLQDVTVKVNDGKGGIVEQKYQILVQQEVGNTAPIIISDPVTKVYLSSSNLRWNYTYDVDAVDADKDNLTYSLIDKPTGMTINPDSGLIAWNPIAQASQSNVKVKVEDGRGGFDTQSFVIELADRSVDLTLADIHTESLVVDGQLLTVSGQVSAQIKNQGLNDLTDRFKVVFFEDRNLNQAYDLGIDTVLGEAQVTTPIQAGQSTTVTTNLSGFLSFINSPIWGFVDADQVITETNENNNLAFSSQDCMIQPSGQFNPVVEWNKNTFSVLPNSNQVMMTPAVIDLDGDKIPDIVFSTFTGTNYTTDGKLRAISGANGSELWTVTNPAYEVRGAAGVAVGDIDNDGKPEILATAESGDALIAFEHDGTFKWRSSEVWGGINWGSASIADLNQDGTPEIIIGATALDNQGNILWQGNSVGGLGRGDNGAGSLSIVADLDLDGSPEVIAGRSAYRANGSLYWNASIGDGFPAIGNFDSDPNPEIVVVSAGQVYLLEHTGQIKWGGVSIPGGGGGGAPTIADVDGDGQPEIGIAGAGRYVVFETDGSIKWTSVTQDNSSNVTGSSVFDFNGDGKAEIVYGDELYLRIYNGSDGQILYQLPKGSGTTYELPLIVDVDADGNAEIVAIANNYYLGSQTGIFVIGDLNDTWVSTRQIWNQHSYHITNINDDGSIPIHEDNSWQTHNTYRLNLQTNYSPLAAPDLTASYLRTEEVSGKTTIKARIGNGGAIFVAAGVNVAFYQGDPKTGGVLLGTTKTTQKLEIGAFEDVSLTVNVTSLQDIWVVADDDGTGTGQVNECNEENNRYSEVFVNGRGEIRGIKWHDLDKDGILNNDPGLANVVVYLDLNNNGLLDSNEPSQITAKDNPNTLDIDETGQYRFTNLSTGTYIVREIIPDQWEQTYPNNPNLLHTVTVAQGEIIKGINFGNVEKNSSRKTFIFTKDAEWNLGVLANINFNTPNNNQLQLNDNIETIFNNVWVSLSGRDGVVRINTDYNDLDDGVVDNTNFTAVLGEYLTRPDGMGGNPSRTTVDRNGDVWVGNRNEGGYLTDVNGNSIPYGSVTKISANMTGNNTSTGVWNATTGTPDTFDRRPWTNTGGVDTDGGTDTAADSGILQYVRVPDGEAVRHLSVDANNNVWVGGYPFALRSFNLVDGENGKILDSFNARTFGAGGYGGLIDSNGVIWSASLSENALLRYDPVTRIAKTVSVPSSYGLGIDSNGYIWNTSAYSNQIYKIDPSGNIVGVFATGGGISTGVTVTTKDNNVWIANRSSNSVTRLDNNGNLLASIAVGGNPTGLSVDSNGKVWVTNYDSDNVMRIDPATNQVDLTVYLGSNADPYNYSDMTGSVVTGVTIPTGTWRTVVDGGEDNQKWEKLLWNTEAEASTPQGTNVKVEMRVANNVADLDAQTWQAFASGSALNLTGRYAEIRATLTKSSGTNPLSPILSDIRLTTLGADAPNIAPIITSNPRTEIAPTRNYQYQIEAQDANGDLLTYSLLNKPVGMTLQNNLLSWVPTSGQLGDYAVEIQVSDGRGGEVTQSFTITVSPDLNNQSPVFTTSVPTTAQVDQVLRYQAKATDPEGDRLTYSLSLKPEGMTIDENTGLIAWKPTAEQLGTHDVILRVQDNLGGVTLQSAQILVQPTNHAPLFTSIVPNNAQVQSGKDFQFQSSAIDPDNDALSYVLASSTGNGITIDATTGLVTWTPDDNQLGTRQFTILAADGKGGQAFQTVTLTVNTADNNQAPIFTSTPRTTTRIGSSYFYQVEATDPNGDALTYSLVNAPTGMTLENGLISWQSTAAQTGQQTVTIQASDGSLTTEQTYQITVSHQASNRAPVITSAPNLTTNIEQIYTYNLTGQDPDGDLVFWSLDQAPSGMVLDIQTGVLRWQPQSNQLGQQEVIVRLLDSYGDYSTQTFTLKVNGANSPANILSNPLTRAAVNQSYTYTVVAVDPENSPLTYSLGRRPDGMTIDATGKVQWTPTQVGSYDIDVSVTDNQGATTTQTYRLEVGNTAINRAPNINSTPGFVANVGSAYQYQVVASDPDGQTLLYQLLQSPQGMTIDTASGLLSWTTPVNGNYQVVVAVFDSEGLGLTQGYTLTARTNSLPIIRSTPKLEAVPNQTYRYDLQAVDPDGDSLSYSLDTTSQALGMILDAQGRLTWTPNNSQLGDHAVTLTAIDEAGGTTQQTFTLKVTADTTAPQVRINRSISLINQGDTVSFQVVATDNIGIANLQLLINDTPVVIDSNGVASFTATTTGVITAKAVALDAAGNRGEATTTVNVLDPTDTEAPTVNLDLSGIVNGEITAPVEIKGSVNDTNLDYYVLEVAPADGSQPFKEMFRGTSTVNNGVLGVLDPTLLPNDTYQVRLVAYDVNGAGNGVSELLDVKGDLKLGNFQLSFTDLEIPVSGIPITLTRTYDTLTSNSQEDFGYGWRMEFRNAQVRTSLPKDELYEEYGFRSVGFKEGDSVYITLPGGKRERFTFSAKPKGLLAFIGLVTPTFLPDDGVTSTLTVADTPLIRGDGGRLIPFSGGSVFGYYMPEDWSSHYTLTTKEGIVYQINTETGDIDSITNRNGDVLSFSDGGIVSSNGQQVTFERDAQGRIVAAIDPMGNRVKYEYDAKGDLVKVTDRENNVTQFKYNATQAHYLNEIIDPLGKTGVRNEYDENGRLTKVFNALGNSVQLEYNPDNSLYTTKDALGNATTYEYDLRGNVITEVDAKGGITRRTYDEDNNLLSETNPEGETSSSTYDSNGNKLTETDGLGNVTRYTYNAKGDLLSTTDALGNTVTNTYDSNGNPTAISGLANGPINLTYGAGGLLTTLTTAEGITTYEYDGRGNVTKEIDPLGHETTYTYDGNGNRLTETRKLTTSAGIKTLVTTTEYNAKGDVIKVTDALGNVTQMAYDANGQKTQEIDALGRVTKYVYSDGGQLLETIYADATPNNDSDNPRTRKEYDAANRVIAEIDELGRRTEFQYDALGRLTFTLFPDLTPNDDSDNPRKESRYDGAGRVIAEVDERGNITRYEYDGLGRRTKTILPDGTANDDSDNPQIVVTYDALGRQLTQVDPLGRTTQYLYDSLGRSTGQIFADQTNISTTYDLAGRVVGKTDQMGNKTQYEYNAVGQLTAVIDALNQRTEYQYNELGNLISQKDALGNTTRYEYDGLGRRIATDLPLGQQATMTYDAVGNVLSTTDFNGETIHFEYDERNRLLSRIFPDNSRVAYTYTLTGQRATETSSLGTITYSYDVRNNLLSRVDADGVKIEYSYDAANNRTAVKVPSGQTSYSFDEQNRLKTVTDPQAGVTTYTYDLAGNLIKTTLANGTTETREYDLLNRLLYLQNSNGNGVINSFRYTLDKVGNRLAIVEQDGRQSNYQYDALYRLLQEEIIDGTTRTISYTYDAVSNRLSRNDSLEGNTSYEYDGNDRLLKEVTNGVTTTYTYDNNGNTLTKTVGTAKTTYEWNVENRLVGADTDGDGVNDVTNEYDGDGIRIRQTVAGEETRFLVDKNRDYAQVLEEYTPSKIIKASYIYGHDLISQLRDTERSFYHVDGLGSTRALTDINGSLTDAYAYEAFGEIIKQLGDTQNSYLFAGEQRDPNLGLDYLRARYLDVNSGRFYGRDPFPEQITNSITLNRYIYVNNSPINFVDPSGEFGMIAGIGFALNALAILSAFGTGYEIGTIINRVRAGESLMSSSNLKSIASVTLALVPLGFLASKVAPLAKVAAELEKLGWKSVIFDTAPGLNFSNRVFHFVQQLYGRGFTSKDAIDAVTKGSVWFDTKTGAIARVIGDARANGTIKVVINKAGKIVTVYSDKLGKKWQQIAP